MWCEFRSGIFGGGVIWPPLGIREHLDTLSCYSALQLSTETESHEDKGSGSKVNKKVRYDSSRSLPESLSMSMQP